MLSRHNKTSNQSLQGLGRVARAKARKTMERAMSQTTNVNREKVAGRKAAIELFNDLMQMDAAYVKGFVEIIKGSLPELEAKSGGSQ